MTGVANFICCLYSISFASLNNFYKEVSIRVLRWAFGSKISTLQSILYPEILFCRLCLPSPQRALAGLGLLFTCMYSGK